MEVRPPLTSEASEVNQFAKRMQRVEDYMNSSSFAAPGGRGLTGLAKDLRSGCEHVIATKGRRVPK